MFFKLHLLLHNTVQILMIQFVSVIVCEDASEGGAFSRSWSRWVAKHQVFFTVENERPKERTPALDSQTFTTKQKFFSGWPDDWGSTNSSLFVTQWFFYCCLLLNIDYFSKISLFLKLKTFKSWLALANWAGYKKTCVRVSIEVTFYVKPIQEKNCAMKHKSNRN